MEILAEIVFALFGAVIEFVFGVVFQLIAELFGFLFGRKVSGAPTAARPWISAITYLAGGAIAGAISLWLAPALWLEAGWQRWANLILMPLLAGIFMQIWDNLRERPQTPPPALAGLYRGFLFGIAMTFVRFMWGK